MGNAVQLAMQQQFVPETALGRYWSVAVHQVDEDQVGQMVEKFADLDIVKREQRIVKHEQLERTGGTADDTNQGSEWRSSSSASACMI